MAVMKLEKTTIDSSVCFPINNHIFRDYVNIKVLDTFFFCQDKILSICFLYLQASERRFCIVLPVFYIKMIEIGFTSILKCHSPTMKFYGISSC
jgi:hypothetical protein